MRCKQDGGFVLFESQAICKYLVCWRRLKSDVVGKLMNCDEQVLKYGATSGLVPPTSQIERYAKYEQALAIESYSTHVQIHDIAVEKRYVGSSTALCRALTSTRRFKPLSGSAPDEEKVKHLADEVKTALAG